jgi:hypothetical protein
MFLNSNPADLRAVDTKQADDDCDFFDTHPDRRHRFRKASEAEARAHAKRAGLDHAKKPPSVSLFIIVRRVFHSDYYLRAYWYGPSCRHDDASEDVCRDLFEKWWPHGKASLSRYENWLNASRPKSQIQ